MKKHIKKLSALLHRKKADTRGPARQAKAIAKAGGDAEIITAFRNGNQKAFAILSKRYSQKLIDFISHQLQQLPFLIAN